MGKTDDIKTNIQVTGFILEYTVGEILRQSGWDIISNRYYLDDLNGVPREIDILAYKKTKVKNINSYTCLLISCKKSVKNDWVFITKDKLNTSNNQIKVISNKWTNDKLIESLSGELENKKHLIFKLTADPEIRSCFESNKEVFAFQEVNKESSKVNNDKPIFSSINSLIKAVNYELSKLPEKSTKPTICNFHLLSVVQTDFFEYHLNGEEVCVNEIHQTLYENKFIVNKKERNYLVDFITFNSFTDRLRVYNKVHLLFSEFYEKLLQGFYSNILDKRDKQTIHYASYGQSLNNIIQNYIPFDDLEMFNLTGTVKRKDEFGTIELINVVFQGKTLDSLTANQKLLMEIKQWLEKWYFIENPVIKFVHDKSFDYGQDDPEQEEHYEDYLE